MSSVLEERVALADEVDAVAGDEHVGAARDDQRRVAHQRGDQGVARQRQLHERLVHVLGLLAELDLHELDAVLRQIDDVDRAVRARDARELLRDEDARVDDHVHAEQAVAHALGVAGPGVSLRARDDALGAELLGRQRRDEVHLVLIGHRDDQIGALHLGLGQDLVLAP
ncbi:MAG: hypothetical protein M5U28_44980 [Sandaracinaceae bacterium]|nr:hypothetical protein [Sandaracinaceae bacterium]